MTSFARPSANQSILDSVRRIVRALRVSSRAAEKRVGLSGAQLFVLQKLDGAEGCSLNELALRTHTHQSSVSAVVSRLVTQRLVTRMPAPADRRRIVLRLTAAGRRALEGSGATVQDALVRSLEGMTERDRARLDGLLARVVRGAGLADAEATLFFEGEGREHAER